ncbi:MAG: hypothetical protein A2087_02710 [Spirochaetes bacterium GWD1_61_31]|nr:MAG: hypothetical protein A2Y37_12770 [Spirochaetes bacterium GWB1_60_80]OHD32925.1 MAG: hypothetical protein A2004_00935 [Spirochaetes bacterium GWC1_61_12]OHD43200.1 MAG: hypothetical protein A2Y35_08185 [Spirochaetes bacterium GWE1_60_18]OHD44176.1 MAG: hypothetical protein A2087_02710 [Spirochaetes bacterium GWD1_61_31]OHD58764.1 MAG: hypothetical protein A2Y32_01030 [Spirochaetes bacterium GWF1_60_12]
MDVLFVNSINLEASASLDCLGTLSLAGVLAFAGYQADIVDIDSLFLSRNFQIDSPAGFVNAVVAELAGRRPRILVFHALGNSYPLMLKIAAVVKAELPTMIILFGGPQASLTAVDTMEAFDFVDAVIIGEAEGIITELVRCYLAGRDPSHLPNLVYRRDGALRTSRRDSTPLVLEAIPHLDYARLPASQNARNVSIEAGRGCAFACRFCSASVLWERQFRVRSPEDLVAQMRNLFQRFGTKSFSLDHALLTAQLEPLHHFCRLLIAADLPIEWSCSARVDSLDAHTIELLAVAGCKEIYLGIETGSPRMQRLVGKGLKLENVRRVARLLRANGIDIIASFIHGFPEETKIDLDATLRMLADFICDYDAIAQLHTLSFQPGTDYYRMVRGTLFADPNYFNMDNLWYQDVIRHCADLIGDRSAIFPNYFNCQTGVSRDAPFLDFFFMLLSSYAKKFRATVTRLLTKHRGDLFAWYGRECARGLTAEIQSALDANLSTVYIKASGRRWLAKLFFGIVERDLADQADAFADEVYRFEKDAFDYGCAKPDAPEIKNYDYNVLNAYLPSKRRSRRGAEKISLLMYLHKDLVRAKRIPYQEGIR